MIRLNKFFLPYIFILLLVAFKGELLISFFMVLLHEMTHYIVSRIYGFSGFDVEVLPIGAVLKLKDIDEAEPKTDIIISLSGPMLNVVLAFIFFMVDFHLPQEVCKSLIYGNIAIASINLVPAFPLDGGRILRDILRERMICKRANKIALNVSIVISIVLFALSMLLIIFHKSNFYLTLISIFVFYSSLKERKRIVYLIMSDIVKKKYKFIKRGYIENKGISISHNVDLIYALSIIDKNKYNIFLVLDDDMKPIDEIYEEELVEALKIYGNISVKDYLHRRN